MYSWIAYLAPPEPYFAIRAQVIWTIFDIRDHVPVGSYSIFIWKAPVLFPPIIIFLQLLRHFISQFY
jgi:hypothetical protein